MRAWEGWIVFCLRPRSLPAIFVHPAALAVPLADRSCSSFCSARIAELRARAVETEADRHVEALIKQLEVMVSATSNNGNGNGNAPQAVPSAPAPVHGIVANDTQSRLSAQSGAVSALEVRFCCNVTCFHRAACLMAHSVCMLCFRAHRPRWLRWTRVCCR